MEIKDMSMREFMNHPDVVQSDDWRTRRAVAETNWITRRNLDLLLTDSHESVRRSAVKNIQQREANAKA